MITIPNMKQDFTLSKKKTNIYSVIISSSRWSKCTLVQ